MSPLAGVDQGTERKDLSDELGPASLARPRRVLGTSTRPAAAYEDSSYAF